jgi:hypothetical protein
MLVAGIAHIVVIRRRNKLEDQEEEGHPQDTDEGEEEGTIGVLDRMFGWWAQLKSTSWSKKHDLIQL